MSLARSLIQSAIFQNLVIAIVVFNSVVLGLLSIASYKEHTILLLIDEWCLYFFVCEVCLKLLIFRREFFKSGWNIFDSAVIALAVFPLLDVGSVVVLRLLRILKSVRMFSSISQLRFIIAVISRSLPSVLCIALLLLLVYYIYAIFGVHLFAGVSPNYFGDLGKTFFTLFQVMTGDSWSEAVARPIMGVYPYSWMYFMSFIVIVSFVVLNMVIGVIVDSVNEIKAQRDQS